MGNCCKCPFTLLRLIYITLLPIVEGQKVTVSSEVTGYLGHDVILPCVFIPGQDNANVSQIEWTLNQGGNETTIIVSNKQYGENIPIPALRERVAINEQSLIIKNAEIQDKGLYKCSVATFPSGSFEGTTCLTVKEHMPLSSAVVSAIVIAVILLVGVMAAIAYFAIMRRCDSSVRHRVVIDTNRSVRDVIRPSFIARDEDVVYSDVKIKTSTDATYSPIEKHRDMTYPDVTYAEVVII